MLPEYSQQDLLLRSSYGSPLLSKANPYERLPERDHWTEHEVRQTKDGVKYRATREAARWAGSYNYEPWIVVAVIE